MAAKGNVKSAITYKMIAEALFENYESIYDINLQTSKYKTYYQSDTYQELRLAKEGEDFFQELPIGIKRIIAPEDQNYVERMLEKDTFLAGLDREKYFRLVYQIQIGEEKIYHQLMATYQQAEDGMHILMGIKNIDDVIQQKKLHENQVESIQQKDFNHLEAVLASAAAYLEANISRNEFLESSLSVRSELHSLPPASEIPSYDYLQSWIGEHLVAANKERYLEVSSRKYLIACHMRGEKRASASFSLYTRNGRPQPCKAVFFLYKEKTSGDLMVFCVFYDLTEQQRKEKELKELEDELSMSRIRNSTSQMKPHFLYNALGSIQEIILVDPQYASDLLGDFMVHLRSCVRAMANDEPIPFSDELKNIQAYVNIEKMRLGKKLEIQYDIETEDFSIIPLCIQPLVENAIRHGVHKRGRIGGTVALRTRSEDNAWIIQVEDTGVGFDAGQVFDNIRQGKKDSTGLNNIRFRLENVMRGSMEIKSTVGEGTLVTVRIPKEGLT